MARRRAGNEWQQAALAASASHIERRCRWDSNVAGGGCDNGTDADNVGASAAAAAAVVVDPA